MQAISHLGAVLGQTSKKTFSGLYIMASKTVNEAESNLQPLQRRKLLRGVRIEKLRSYLVHDKCTVYTDHSPSSISCKERSKGEMLRVVLLRYKRSTLKSSYSNVVFLAKAHDILMAANDGPIGGHQRATHTARKVEAKALPTNDARVVCKLLKSLFARFGAPLAIISDRGTHFCNDQFAKVMLKYGVTHHLSTAYHRQTSGQVEVSNRGLKRILESIVGENRASWSDKVDDVLWAFRTTYKTPIGCTPYKLVYRKACHLPIELEHKAYWALKHANFDLKTTGDHRKVQLNELNELCDHAYENSLIYKEKTKRIHDSKIKNRVFNVGDQVLLFNSRLKIFLGKLKSPWSGPYTIAHVFPYGIVELSQNSRPNFKACTLPILVVCACDFL
ncbi:reverse transcriptase domain-containing protein [Tanacetum coccineum]